VYLNLRDAGLKEEGTSAVIKALTAGKQSLVFLDLSGECTEKYSSIEYGALRISWGAGDKKGIEQLSLIMDSFSAELTSQFL
jgi:hypothetical protein